MVRFPTFQYFSHRWGVHSKTPHCRRSAVPLFSGSDCEVHTFSLEWHVCCLLNPGIPPQTILVPLLSLGPAGGNCVLLSLCLLIQLRKRTIGITKFQVDQMGYVSYAKQDQLAVRPPGLLRLQGMPWPILYACCGNKHEKQWYAKNWPSSSDPLFYFWLFVLFYRYKRGRPEKDLPMFPRVLQGCRVEFWLQATDQCAGLEVCDVLLCTFL